MVDTSKSVKKRLAEAWCLLLFGITLFPAAKGQAQQTPASPEFEVASIKQNLYGGTVARTNFPLAGTAYKPTGGRLAVKNYQLAYYIAFAYDLTSTQMKALQSQVDGWVFSNRYDIEARSEAPNPTKYQMRQMMRSLLASRFKLTVHHETRETSVLALVPVKAGQTGPQLPMHPDDSSCADAPGIQPEPGAKPEPPKTVAGGFVATCDGLITIEKFDNGNIVRSLNGRDVTLRTLASTLSTQMDYPIVDRTGLKGTFDVLLSWDPTTSPKVLLPPGRGGPPQPTTTSDFSGPTIEEALKTQLGLKLEKQKDKLDFLVIDHIERPSEN